MPYFVDTSALFKRYQSEKGTASVCRILEATDQPTFISSITIIEIISNLKRLYEIDKITTEEQFLQQRSFFYEDINRLGITILDITTKDIIKAEDLILKRYMKPVDSVQLAIALNLRRDNMTFVSADRRLCRIAVEEGLNILAP
ncbi:PIN domain protein [Candidatus Methylomirabilis lanthanidiphila]|uniref:PIN domain protein n=1 Tax=Candidatus Methylomirabilis lanthanidiphila TaxID=2211376 RepID=A0A564ZKZ1_9BACT|nr:type II toxin-antitoxin system VapC family toxin [Candidatus Methylomirabilis lanthanidiphila]VUZ85833.1 PIN domain protein [Candidatus Methylomirabilis lanthanidiphila]